MANLSGFDANEVEPMQAPGPLPAGEYKAAIIKSEMKKTKNNKGEYLSLTFEVLEGEQKGRRAWTNLNLVNENTTAVAIARQELSSICRAVGVLKPNDSAQLHDIPLMIHVAVEDQDRNRIKKYDKTGGSTKPATSESATKPSWA